MIITVSNLDKAFGSRTLFSGADLQVAARDRVALVGPNGSGKTTLLEMIVGEQLVDGGSISVRSGAVLGFLRQETDDMRGRSVLEEVLSVSSDVTAAGHRLELLQAEIAETDGDERQRLIDEYGRLQDRFSTLGGYQLEPTARKILAGLGFADADQERPTETFSGGWLMRIALAKLLLANPDVLMLDEPTNHLDLASVEWLEGYLAAYEGAVILISHDRDFINGLATRVVELFDLKLVSYVGNFEDFVRQREMHVAQLEAATANRERQVAATQRFIGRFRYKASKAKQVQSRIKSLERMEALDKVRGPSRTMKLAFPPAPRSGRVVLEFDDLSFGYGEQLVYEGLDLAVERGQKVALVGPNGAGKTTMLKLAAGVLTPSSGVRRTGHGVEVGYFAQHQVEALRPENTVLQELETAIPPGAQVRARDLLGRFLFSGEDVKKPVEVLSGGERTRLALAKLLVSPINLLCVDEPTNHLDMQSRDALEDALREYSGAMMLITHDRHLIRNIANRIFEIDHGRVAEHLDFDRYVQTRAEAETSSTSRKSGPHNAKERRRVAAAERARTAEHRKEVARLEKQLELATEKLAEMSETLADPDIYSSDADVGELVRDYERLRKRKDDLEERWVEATAQLEAAEP